VGEGVTEKKIGAVKCSPIVISAKGCAHAGDEGSHLARADIHYTDVMAVLKARHRYWDFVGESDLCVN